MYGCLYRWPVNPFNRPFPSTHLAIQLRRFALVTLLEGAEALTEPKSSHEEEGDGETKVDGDVGDVFKQGSVDARVTITFDEIVLRMVAYVRAHNFDMPNMPTCILVMTILKVSG